MKLINYITIACTLFLISCSEKPKSNNEYPVSVDIDLDRIYTDAEKKDFINKLKIRLLPLESNPQSYFGGDYMYTMSMKKGLICVFDSKTNSVILFDDKGHFIRNINRQGRGPQEYVRPSSVVIRDGILTVKDVDYLVQYDTTGRFIRKIEIGDGIGQQLTTFQKDKYITLGLLQYDYQVKVYDAQGNIVNKHFPQQPEFADFPYNVGGNLSLTEYNDDAYLTRCFDPSIYKIANDSIECLYKFTFGKYNIPPDMLTGTSDAIGTKYQDLRKSIVNQIDYLNITNDWIIFSASIFRNSKTVFFNRNNQDYILNTSFDKAPYNVIFNMYNQPLGVNEHGEFYTVISSMELKQMIEELKASGDVDKYDFLSNIDPETINEEGNYWIVLFSLD